MKLKIFCDGGSRGNPGPAACAVIIKDENNKIIFSKGFYLGVTTNNQAEYQAVVEALHYLNDQIQKSKIQTVNFYLDSELVVKQLNGVYKIKDKNILQKVLEIKNLKLKIKNLSMMISHIPREQNYEADKIVNDTLDSIQ